MEDEIPNLKVTTLMLEREGYTILAAASPKEAVRIENSHPDKIDMLLTDVVMPEMNGQDLAEKILSDFPGMKCLFMSGYTANVIAHHGILDKGVHFIQKPLSRNTLCAKVREVLDSDKPQP